MERKIEPRLWQTLPQTLTEKDFHDTDSLKSWLEGQAGQYQLDTLLAHADNAVIWGRVDEAGLHLSSDCFNQDPPGPRFNLQTLQECRLFGPTAELYLWRDEDRRWQARVIQDGTGSPGETLDERQILWGDEAVNEENGFTLVSDGAQGNRHAPPLPRAEIPFDPGGDYRPLRLLVRHYLSTDLDPTQAQTGLAYIGLSRLVKVYGEAAVVKQTTEIEEALDELA